MLEPITKKYTDESEGNTFRFTFYCDHCGSPWHSNTYNTISASADTEEAAREHQRDHDNAFERANHDAIYQFNHCPLCRRRVCQGCYRILPECDVCVECAEKATGRKDAGVIAPSSIEGYERMLRDGGINMAFCKSCGTLTDTTKKFCEKCGAEISEAAAPQQGQQYQQTFQQGVDKLTKLAQEGADETVGMDTADIDKNKVMGGLAYLLFFLPLIACPESKFGRFHANQGLILLIMGIAGGIVSSVLATILGAVHLWFIISLISYAIRIVVIVMLVIGLVNGFGGKAKELPVVGGIRIIK